MTLREQAAFYQYWTAKPGVISLAAVEGDRFIGHVVLRTLDLPAQHADLGISLDPAVVGQGLGTQILRATLQYAAQHGITTVGLDVATYNQRAISAYCAAGFREIDARWMQYESTIDFATLLAMPQYQWLREHVRYEDGYIVKILRMST